MAIVIDQKEKLFTLHTAHTTYQMKADRLGTLLHLYYGRRTDDSDKSYILSYRDRGFSGNPYEVGKEIKTYSLDVLPQEYSCYGTGDYRISGLKVQNEDGSQAAALHYREYRMEKGKYAIPGLPAVYADEEEAQTLEVILEDVVSGASVVWRAGSPGHYYPCCENQEQGSRENYTAESGQYESGLDKR